MPIAIPMLSDFGEEMWVEREYAFYDSRVLRLFKELDSKTAQFLSKSIDFLNIEDDSTRIQLWIHSLGGRVKPAVINLYEAMQDSEAPLQTFCLGRSASTATLLLMGGTPGVRVAFPDGKIGMRFDLAHYSRTPPREQKRGRTKPVICRPLTKPSVCSVMTDLEQNTAIRQRMANLIARRTGNPFSVIYNDMQTGGWMTPDQAKAYGIIDRIGLGPIS